MNKQCIRWLASLTLQIALFQSSYLYGYEVRSDDYWVLTNLEPPFSQLDERGQPSGYTVELVEGILRTAGVDQDVLAAPWGRILKESLNKPNVFVFALARTAERESLYHWITPITTNVYGIFGPAGDREYNNLSEMASLGTIAVLEGDFRQAVLQGAGVPQKGYPSWAEALSALLDGDVQGLFSSNGGVDLFCERLNRNCDHIQRLYTYELVTTYLVLSSLHSSPGEVAHFQTAAKEFKASKEYQQLADKWLKQFRANDVGPMHVADGVFNLWAEEH